MHRLLVLGFLFASAPAAAYDATTPPWRLDTDLRLRGDYLWKRNTTEGALAEASVRASFGSSDSRGSIDASVRRYRLDSSNDSDVLLREALFAQHLGSSRVVLGKQLLLWGRADGFRVLDVLVPADIPDAFYEEAEDSRRGLWAARLDWQVPQPLGGELQLWFTPDRSLQRHVPSGADLPALRSRASQCGGTCNTSALRWSSQWGHVDGSLHVLHGPWRETSTPPLFDGTRLAPTVDALGASFDVPINRVVLRAEALHVARVESPIPHAVPQDRVLVGLDVDVGGVTISPQVFMERAAVDSAYASLLIDARLRQDRLRLRLFTVQSLRESEQRWLSGRLRWIASDTLEYALSLDHFSGLPTSALGALAQRSRISIDVIWRGRWRPEP